MKLLFLTTAIIKDSNIAVLKKMLDSVTENLGLVDEASIEHLVLLQNCDAALAATIQQQLPAFVTTLHVENIVSLSKARNILIDEVDKLDLWPEQGIVGFPDDDCWFPAGNLAHIINEFSASPTLDFFFCKYGSAPEAVADGDGVSHPATASEVVRNASSNTIFFRGKIARQTGGFDLKLGVGTINNGGEDLDYALRAFLLSADVRFLNRKIVGHRDKDQGLRAKYYRGSAIVLKRYASDKAAIAYEYLRKLAIGVVLMLKRELPVGEFALAWRYREPLVTHLHGDKESL